jgi:hypothetical protein
VRERRRGGDRREEKRDRDRERERERERDSGNDHDDKKFTFVELLLVRSPGHYLI